MKNMSFFTLFNGNKSTVGGGGAIKVDFQIPSNRQVLNSYKDVFYKNSATSSNTPTKGGAINISNNNSMMIALSILGYNTGEKNYENVFVESNHLYVNDKTEGIDNGENISGISEKIFGKYPVELLVDNGKENWRIGSKNKRAKHVWLPIIPNISDKYGNELAGIAMSPNNSITNDTEIHVEDLGIEMTSSLLYDANGGNFNLPEMTSYKGEYYYEGPKPKYYSEVNRMNYANGHFTEEIHIIKDAKKDLNIERKGYTFLGWSTKHDAKTSNIQLDPGTSIHVAKQRKLFAIWEPNNYQLTYYGNDKSSGSVPKATKGNYNSFAIVKKSESMKRKGHKFLGWSTKSNQSKADAKYTPGSKVKMAGNVKLYPVWKANKYTLKYNNTSKTSGAAPKNVNATYGKSYTIKNAGSMKRKGYKFLGWSKKAKQSKADAKLKPGKKLKVLGTTNLYPVWKKAK